MSLDDDKTLIGNSDDSHRGELAPGSQFGQFRIVRLLGRGGMGEVYEVEHVDLIKRYALKIISSEVVHNTEAVGRFRKEARVMAALEHPNLVRVDDFGETQGKHWIRMELIGSSADQDSELQMANSEGESDSSLRDYLNQRGGKLPEAEVKAILEQILEGLAYAHSKGVIHRDLKPANILLAGASDSSRTSDPASRIAKIADFGLVRMVGEDWLKSQVEKSVARSMSIGAESTRVDETASGGTSTKALLGTYAYMSPEQKRGEEVDERSDLYAVGLMAYQMLTGMETMGMKLPSRINPEISIEWDNWLEKATELDRIDRFSSAQVMLEKMQALKLGVMENSVRASSKNNKPFSDAATISTAPRKRRSLWLPAILISAFALLAFLGWSYYQQWQSDRAEAESVRQAQDMADAEAMRLRGEIGVALAAGDLAGAGRLLAELEERGASAGDLRARYEGMASAREARARAGEAEVLRERVMSLYQRDGEGLGGHYDTMESSWRTAERAFGGEVWGEALSGYDRVLREGNALLELERERARARELRSAVEGRLPQVRDLVERADEGEARQGLSSAQASLSAGIGLYERSAFAEAAEQFTVAEATLGQAQGRAEAVLAWREAKGRWERALGAADRETLDSYGGDAWQRLRSVAAAAERSLSDPVAGLRQYEEALAGLSGVERGARAEQSASALRAALGEARAAKSRSEWEAVLAAAERALGLDSRNAEALALKREAEGHLEPRLRLVALVNGREVPATVRVGNRSERLPHVFELERDARFTAEVSYESGGVRYRPERVELTADWRGVRERRLTLEEVRGPMRGPMRGQDYSMDLGGGVTMEFVWISALNAWVGKYEVTNAEYGRSKPEHDSGHFERNNRRFALNGPRQPVVRVNYDDAVAFTQWLNGREGLREGSTRARLLSGDEWTAIARCGTNREYPWGNSMPPTRGNYSDLTAREELGFTGIGSYRDGFAVTAPVEQSGRNEWGLYGVGGNVWEWTSEQSGSSRVLRGASWSTLHPVYLRVEFRGAFRPSYRDGLNGFRVVLSGGG